PDNITCVLADVIDVESGEAASTDTIIVGALAGATDQETEPARKDSPAARAHLLAARVRQAVSAEDGAVREQAGEDQAAGHQGDAGDSGNGRGGAGNARVTNPVLRPTASQAGTTPLGATPPRGLPVQTPSSTATDATTQNGADEPADSDEDDGLVLAGAR